MNENWICSNNSLNSFILPHLFKKQMEMNKILDEYDADIVFRTHLYYFGYIFIFLYKQGGNEYFCDKPSLFQNVYSILYTIYTFWYRRLCIICMTQYTRCFFQPNIQKNLLINIVSFLRILFCIMIIHSCELTVN